MPIFSAEERLESIIRRYADMIYRVAYQNTYNKADADDIFQEVCVSLLTKNPPLDNEAHLKHWLLRVTLNKCKNLHLSAWNRRTEGLTDNLPYEPDDLQLLEEVRRLPKNHRNAVYLHYYEGYSAEEIAALLGVKPNTVLSWLHRGRKKLKEYLSD